MMKLDFLILGGGIIITFSALCYILGASPLKKLRKRKRNKFKRRMEKETQKYAKKHNIPKVQAECRFYMNLDHNKNQPCVEEGCKNCKLLEKCKELDELGSKTR
ncbi:hypothetical protein M2146_002503 [Lachnospiraceae bacterium PF1-22]